MWWFVIVSILLIIVGICMAIYADNIDNNGVGVIGIVLAVFGILGVIFIPLATSMNKDKIRQKENFIESCEARNGTVFNFDYDKPFRVVVSYPPENTDQSMLITVSYRNQICIEENLP